MRFLLYQFVSVWSARRLSLIVSFGEKQKGGSRRKKVLTTKGKENCFLGVYKKVLVLFFKEIKVGKKVLEGGSGWEKGLGNAKREKKEQMEIILQSFAREKKDKNGLGGGGKTVKLSATRVFFLFFFS